MRRVKVTELRKRLQGYLKDVQHGDPIQITSHGRVIARLVPEPGVAESARESLDRWAESAKLGDGVSPVGEEWEAESDRL